MATSSLLLKILDWLSAALMDLFEIRQNYRQPAMSEEEAMARKLRFSCLIRLVCSGHGIPARLRPDDYKARQAPTIDVGNSDPELHWTKRAPITTELKLHLSFD